MKKGITCILAVLLVHTACAEGFHSVYSPNGFDVWAVGNAGSIFHSVDGGVMWGSLPQGSATLRSVCAIGQHVWIVGDGGTYLSSTDNGVSWSGQTLNSGNDLNAIQFMDTQTGWIAGSNGALLKSTDGGQTWNGQITGTTNPLKSLSFLNGTTGYAAGTGGVLLKTTDGGNSWPQISPVVWSEDLYTVSAKDAAVVVGGRNGICYKSTNAGASWTSLDFSTDSRSDLNSIFLMNADSLFFAGGGGYVRRSFNGGILAPAMQHPLLATASNIYFSDQLKGWMCSNKNNAIIRTTDGGTTWSLPQGTSVSFGWSQKLSISATVRGNTFCINPWNKDIIYEALGTRIYASYDRGETWAQVAILPSPGSKANSFYVSPHDTNLWVAAYGSTDRIVRSTDHGATWSSTLTRDFSEYGMPLEMDSAHPDTLLFGPEDGYLYRSTNFGLTWDTLSHPNFRSPCDIVILYDNSSLIWVGDGVTGSGQGQMFRSEDGGVTFSVVYTTNGSEIPTIASNRLDGKLGFATAWSSGGVRKTMDGGGIWNSVATTGSTWGVDIAKDDPNVIMYGVYGGGTSYLSTNAGSSFITSNLGGSNYALLCYDRGTFFAQQSGGVFKYNISYTVPVTNTQVLSVITPNGGESWEYNSTQNILWTATNIANVNIEFATSPAGPWQTIASNVPAANGTYAWLVPNIPTATARVRVRDALDNTPVDSSDNYFSITAAGIAANPASLNLGSVMIGHTEADTVRISNSGTAMLVVSSVTTGSPYFIPGRTSFTIPPGSSDTLSVTFAPAANQAYADTLRIVSNAPSTPLEIPISGMGTPLTGAPETETGIPAKYALRQNYPNPFNPSTIIRYDLPQESRVELAVYNTLGQKVADVVDAVQQAGRYSVEFNTGGRNVSSGIYFYRLRAGNYIDTKKMLLLK